VRDWFPRDIGSDVATVAKDVDERAAGPRRVTYTIDWTGALRELRAVSITVDCQQIEQPTPTPTPTDGAP